MTTTLRSLLAVAIAVAALSAGAVDGASAACKRGDPNCLTGGGGPKPCGSKTNPCRINSGLGSQCKGSGAQCGVGVNLP